MSTLDRIRDLARKCGVEMISIISTEEGRQGLLGKLSANLLSRSSPDFELLKPDDQFWQLSDNHRKRLDASLLSSSEDLLRGDNLHDLLLIRYVNQFSCDTVFSALGLSHVNMYDLQEQDKAIAVQGR